MRSAATMASHRFAGLDMLRVLAVVAVLVGHGKRMLVPPGAIQNALRGLGPVGVEVFFVLSGYLIGTILIREAAQPGFSAWAFLRRRWWRTVPAYLLALVVFGAFAWTKGWWPVPDWRYLLFMQNLWSRPDTMRISWSLAIEEWSYLLLGVAAWRLRGRIHWMAWALVLGAWVGRAVYWDVPDVILRQAVVFRLDAVALGVLVAKYRPSLDAPWLPRAGLGLLVVSVATISGFRGHNDQLIDAAPVVKLLWLPCMQAGVAACIPAAERLQAGAAWHRPALYAYSVYLFHQPVRYVMEAAPTVHGLTWVVWVAAVFAVAAAVYHLYEAPMTRLRDAPSLWGRMVAPKPVAEPVASPQGTDR